MTSSNPSEPRFWVNEVSYEASLDVSYPGAEGSNVAGQPMVGIVDEQEGGMVLYVDPSQAEHYCNLLNTIR